MASKRARQSKKKVSEAASGLQDLIDSSEELLESMKEQQGVAAEKLREKITATLENARARLSQLDVPEIASDAVDSTAGFLRSDLDLHNLGANSEFVRVSARARRPRARQIFPTAQRGSCL
jgi:ElaB/YqjD/DUF883 family membrane-anchored ribosome-binding protein